MITAREMQWDKVENGDLMDAATGAGFGVFVSIDKKIEHEHNLSELPLPVVILDVLSNALPHLLPLAPALLSLLDGSLIPALYVIAPDGSVQRLTTSR